MILRHDIESLLAIGPQDLSDEHPDDAFVWSITLTEWKKINASASPRRCKAKRTSSS